MANDTDFRLLPDENPPAFFGLVGKLNTTPAPGTATLVAEPDVRLPR
jgi:hypothetical protein